MSDDGDSQMMNDDFKMQLNRNLQKGAALSDDEGKSSPAKSATKKDMDNYNQFTNTSKKVCGSSLDVAGKI